MSLATFGTPPASIVPWQRRLLIATSLLVALTRLAAISATLCEWDESLFVDSLRDYDVTMHHPHPPGFPVYVLLARVVTLFSVSEFRALQTVVVFSAMALFPLAFFLGRELRLGFRTSYLGALLFVFLPNVWYLGGTGYSDVPSIALVLGACALMLRGCRDVRAYYAGALVLGLAAGIRPQSLLIALAPVLMASWAQFRVSWRRFVAAAFLGAAVLAASYGGAMLASRSVAGYMDSVRGLRVYLREVDSVFNPQRLPLSYVAASVFVRPIPGGRMPLFVLAVALVGAGAAIVRRDMGVGLLLAMFAPFSIFAWLMLDPHSVFRYSISWLPMYALLAAYGVRTLMAAVPRLVPAGEIVLIGALVLRFAWWTWPALELARTTAAPAVAAFAWAAGRGGTIYYEGSLGRHASALRPGRRAVNVVEAKGLPVKTGPGDVWVEEGVTASLDTKLFERKNTRFAEIVRERYLVVSATPASSVPIMGDGWWDEEFDGENRWRWMKGRSVTRFGTVGPKARLTLRAACAVASQMVTVTVNDRPIATFPCSPALETRQWIVPAHPGARNEVILTTDRVVNPSRDLGLHDARDLGLRLEGIGWSAAP